MSFTSETARLHGDPTGSRLLAAPRCQYCARIAMRGARWCHGHRPGPRPKIKRPNSRPKVDLLRLANEAAATRLANPLSAWAPVRRLSAMRPIERAKLGVGVADVMHAAVAAWAGDPEAWSAVVRRLSDAGLLLPGDPPPTAGS